MVRKEDLISAVSNLWNGTNVSAHAYANDALGRRTARLDRGAGDSPVVFTNGFGYNTRSEVTAVTLQNSETLELSNVSYAYDPIGNRTGATNGAAAFSYSANALNQYSNLQSTAYSLQPSYDPDGNMLTNGPWAYTWDAENRLVSATDGERTVYYAYDHRSRLTYRCALTPQGMAESAFTYDGWNPLDEFHYENSGPGE